MAEQLNLQVNVTGNAVQTVGSIKKELKEASLALIDAQKNFGEYSNEAIQAAKKVAQLKDSIQEAKETADLFDPGKKFQALSGALSSVAGGFAAVQGAIGLFGGESKELEKQLLKVQSALALSQGLSTIADAGKDFKRLKTIIELEVIPAFKKLGAATQIGIGLLITAVAGLIYAWVEYIDTQEQVKKAQEETNKAIAEGAKAELTGATEALERERRLAIARLEGRKNNEKEIFETEQQFRRLKIKALERYYAELRNKDSKEATDALNQIKSLNVDIQIEEIKQVNKLAQIKKDAQDKEKERLKKLRDDEQEAIKRASALELQAIENRSKAAEEARKKEDADVAALFEEEDKRQEKRIEKSNKRILDDKKEKEALIEAEYALADAKFQAASAGLALLGTLVSKNEKLQNALFIADRALAIAKVIIDTQREIAGYAAANAPLGPAGLAITATMASAAKIRAAASIATIAATTIAKFKGGGTNAGSNFGPSIPTLGAMSPIQPQASLTQLNQQMINAIGNQAIRAYVVETDITTNQRRIEAIKQKAKFG